MNMTDDNGQKDLKEEISDLKKRIHDLEKDLIHDSLTSLKTRAFFEEELNTYLFSIENVGADKRREWFGFKNLSVLFFDIDNFKKINDTYGHQTGDAVLKKVAHTIVESLREGDTVARWGGEEIVASILGANEVDAKNKADEIRKNIENISFDTAQDLKVTISIGVSSNFTGATCEALLKNADLCLYKAKRDGKNRVVAFSELG